MPIKKPGPRLMVNIKLKAARQHVSKKAGRTLDVSLNLTPMIDMFVVLVIFLLMSFSTSAEVVFLQKQIDLPKASLTQEIEQAPVITVGSGRLVIDKREVGVIQDIKENEDFEIADLSEVLLNIKKHFQQIHPDKRFHGNIIIQGDKGVSFRVLKKIMYTCTAAGYGNINFAVLPKKSQTKTR
jgi:biopolymer transport protein ExbD